MDLTIKDFFSIISGNWHQNTSPTAQIFMSFNLAKTPKISYLACLNGLLLICLYFPLIFSSCYILLEWHGAIFQHTNCFSSICQLTNLSLKWLGKMILYWLLPMVWNAGCHWFWRSERIFFVKKNWLMWTPWGLLESWRKYMVKHSAKACGPAET